MSVNNINNLANIASTTGSSSPVSGSSGLNGLGNSSRLNRGVDWFSQLDAGKAYPMQAQDQFGANPSLDDIVNKIAEHLGIQD